jgi:hypothetical protein
MEVKVTVKTCFDTESCPAAPHSIYGFMAGFMLGVKDDSAICSTCKAQDKMLGGRGKISKFAGIYEFYVG